MAPMTIINRRLIKQNMLIGPNAAKLCILHTTATLLVALSTFANSNFLCYTWAHFFSKVCYYCFNKMILVIVDYQKYLDSTILKYQIHMLSIAPTLKYSYRAPAIYSIHLVKSIGNGNLHEVVL